jgi:hypothetical protein
LPIQSRMRVSGVSSSEYRSPESIEAERAMLVLRQMREAQKAQAQALVDLVKQSGDVGRIINVTA